MNSPLSDDAVVSATRDWVEKAVIGLNLCPFAKATHARGLIRYVVSPAQDEAELERQLTEELLTLVASPAAEVETTLLIHPKVLNDFLDFNDFLTVADATLRVLDLEGEIQIASFHPAYRFAGQRPDDIENYTNRSPYPVLHLLRESSIDQAVAAFPEASDIYERNIETMRRLGHAGWRRVVSGDAKA